LINYYEYKKDPEKFKKKKNNLDLTDNPFENILSNPTSWKIGIISVLMVLINLYVLKKLPLSLYVPFGLLWLIFALFLNKIMRDVNITFDKIISILMLIVGVLFMQYHHFKDNNLKQGKEKINYTMLLGMLLISQLLKAYQVNVIKIVEDYVIYKDVILMDYGIMSILSIVLYLIYLYSPVKFWKVSFPEKSDVLKMILITIFIMTTSIILKFKALQNLSESKFSLINTTNIIISIVFGKLFFGESITFNQIAGSLIIIFGIMYNDVIKYFHNSLFYHNITS
jgi:drug/metabolite transporter (DMT)-like permease